jgi:hypothetical protein
MIQPSQTGQSTDVDDQLFSFNAHLGVSDGVEIGGSSIDHRVLRDRL